MAHSPLVKTAFKTQRIAVIGAGAVGCYYGGNLAATGHDVHFLMRSDLDSVRKNGLLLQSDVSPDIHLVAGQDFQAYGSPEEIGPVDLVIISLKTTSNDALEKLIPPLLHENTALVTLQNGLGNEEFLAERFGAQRIMGALCFVCLNRVAPGVIRHFGYGSISVGELTGPPIGRTTALVDALRDAGIESTVVDNLITERWRKLVWNIPFNGLSIAAGEITTQDILQDPGLEIVTRRLMREIIEIANANGHSIADSYIDFQVERTRSMGPYKPSSLLDYEKGLPVEVEPIWGRPYHIARNAGLNVGRLETLYFLLKHLAAGKLSARLNSPHPSHA